MRARVVRPIQWPSGSRSVSGTFSDTCADSTGCVMPRALASSRREMSTVSSTSAGELRPSAAMRSASPLVA